MSQAVGQLQPERAKPTAHILPGGNSRLSILRRLFNWRRTHFAAWRIKLARLGWKRLYFYSVGLAFGFLRAFWRLSRRLGLKESVHWTSGGVRLARADTDLAAEYFDSVSDLMLRLPPEARGRLLALTADLPHLYSTETARERLRLALAIVEATPDYELVARILDVAISITRSSLGYSRDFLRQAAEIVRHYDAANPLQRALFLRALDLTGRFTTHLGVKFFNSAAPFISNARSEGDEASATQLCARLFEHTETLMDFGHGGALNFFLSGLELLRLGDETTINKWAELCGIIGRGELREFAVFTERAIEPTRALVSLELARGEQARALVASALDHAIVVSERNLTAAINCYLASPELLRRMSLAGYETWVERGLASFAEPEKLAAYFSAETRASQSVIEETAGALRLDDVSHVLTSYVRMLTGKALPIAPRPMKYGALEPDTGECIGLPESINGLRNNEERFRLYKALAAQAAGQIEFGTYETGTEEFRALGLELRRHFPRLTPARLNGNADWLTLVTLFPLTTLARRLFTILENARVERQLRLRYRGLGRELDMACGQRRRSRPPDQYLVKYEGLLDLLFKEALGAGVSDDEPDLDDEQRAWLKKAREALAARIYKDGANVADTVRACLDLYDYLSPAPPENSLPWQDPHTRPEREEKGEKQQPRRERPRREVAGQPAAGQPEEKPEEQPAIATGAPEVEPAFLSFASTAAEGGALDDLRDPNVFFYDEWDCRIGDYRARWCRVTERDWEQGDPSFARKTLSAYRGALSQVRYQFQLMRPAGLRRVRGLVDGDNFDLEAVIDHIVDRRARATPSDRIYSERQRRERDVAVFFLIDLSSSTFNRVSGGKHLLDVEKEALLLMSEALEAVGDAYAIYGFSSHGRRYVSFYRFKDFAEPYGERIERRIGAARSLTNTRLGAAIRHATWRLNRQPSATRLLIILSDGRPADDEYVNERYAREDTRVALAEARASGAMPFFIVVNESGSPELEEMLTGVRVVGVAELQPRSLRSGGDVPPSLAEYIEPRANSLEILLRRLIALLERQN